MVDLSKYSDEQLDEMLNQMDSQNKPSSSKGSDLSKYSDEELDKMLGEQPAHPGVAGGVAAGLRGMRESLPFGEDIGAASYYIPKKVKSLFTGEEAPSFEEEKRKQIEQDEALYREHPYAYGTGYVGGLGGQILEGGLPAAGLAAEKFLAKKATPYVGEVAGKAAGVAGTGALTGAVYGGGQGVTPEERLENAVSGAELGAGIGLGSAAASKGLQRLGVIGKPPASPPLETTRANIKEEAQSAYEAAHAAGLRFNQEAIKKLNKDIVKELEKKEYRPGIHTDLKHAMSEIASLSRGKLSADTGKFEPVTLKDLERANRYANNALKSSNDETRLLGGIFKDKISEFLDSVTPAQTYHFFGDPKEVMNSLKTARDFWKRQKKLQTLETLDYVAQQRAQNSNTNLSEGDRIKAAITSILAKQKTRPHGWTTDEIKAMEDILKTGKMLKFAGRFDPFKSKTGMVASGAAMLSDPTLGIGLSAATHTAEKYGEHQILSKFKDFQDLIAAGGRHFGVKKKPSVRAPSATARQALIPPLATGLANKGVDMDTENREERASGGKVGKKDYPAKRLTRMERAIKRAQDAIALETKPIMNQPDHVVAQALEIAKGR